MGDRQGLAAPPSSEHVNEVVSSEAAKPTAALVEGKAATGGARAAPRRGRPRGRGGAGRPRGAGDERVRWVRVREQRVVQALAGSQLGDEQRTADPRILEGVVRWAA